MTVYPSVLRRSPTELTAEGYRAYKDPMMRPGCRLLVDYTDQWGANPYPEGPIAPGARFEDLHDVPVAGTVTVSAASTARWNNRAGRAGLVRTVADGGAAITYGAPGELAIPVNHEILFGFWISMPEVGFNASAHQELMFFGPAAGSNKGNGAACTIYASMGGDGKTPTIQMGTPDGTAPLWIQSSAGAATGKVLHMAARYRPVDGMLTLYVNGAVVFNAALAGGPSNMQSSATHQFVVKGRFVGAIFRHYLFDLTEAVATETAWGLDPSDILDAGNHVIAEHNYVAGLNPAAPRPLLFQPA